MKRKRQEEGPTGTQKRFCDLDKRRKQQLVTAAVTELKVLSRGDAEELLEEVRKRVTGADSTAERAQMFEENIANFCDTHLPTLPDRCRIAASLTKGMPLKEAEELSGVVRSSISWARQEIKGGIKIYIFFQSL